ncbi:MAG: ArnT family glycosyltransferase [Ktedonobacterales bacterium]
MVQVETRTRTLGARLPAAVRWGLDKRQVGLVGAALAVLALQVCFHFYRLGETPGWDPQEGYNLDIAWNLAHGRLRLFALTSAFAQHPPLFYLQLVVAMRVMGYSIVAVRAVAAIYSVLTCGALLLVGRRMVGIGAALWGALAFTVAPIILANTRWGYSYAQLAFVGMLCLWAGWRYRQTTGRGWLVVAAALAGIAALSDYEGVAWIAFIVLVALQRRQQRDALLAMAIGVGVLGMGLLGCLVANPGVFFADFGTTFTRAAGGNVVLQVILLLLNYYRFVTLDAWVLLGIAGFFLVPAQVRGYLLGALAMVALVALKVREIGLSLHSIVPLLPLLALGMGVAFDLGLRRLYGWSLGWMNGWLARTPEGDAPAAQPFPRRFGAALLVFVVVISPLGLALASDASGLSGTLPTRQDALLATPGDAQATMAYVVTHAHAGDLVLASPEIAWRFDHPGDAPALAGADILQAVAQSGQSAAFYPAGLPADRWAYDVSAGRARYVVVDNLLRQLEAPEQVAALAPLLAQVRQWPVVFARGQYVVYERPTGTGTSGG